MVAQMENRKPIPSLGQTAREVIKAALNYPCAGFILKFKIVGSGEWYFDPQEGNYRKLKWSGPIPFSEEVGLSFDGWLETQVSKGYVGIWVEASGPNPHFSIELHRATATKIPLGE
jgi:hypothetical protein